MNMHKAMGIGFPIEDEEWISCGNLTTWLRHGQVLVVYWLKEPIYIKKSFPPPSPVPPQKEQSDQDQEPPDEPPS